MTMPILEKIRGFMFTPSFAFRKVKDEDAGESIKYLMVLAVFYAIMSALMTAIEIFSHPFLIGLPAIGANPVEPFLFISWVIVILVVTLLMAVFFGLWLHVWVYLLGGKKGVWQTEKSVFYNLTPTFLLGWIPVIGPLVGGVWSVIIGVIGVKELHGMPDTRAAIAVVLSIVIASVLVVLILGAMLLAVVSSLVVTV
ncbi:MAG TPA: YIP1 family protein [Methanolinea sp.]|nr:YIP1 family protein [Methanolinea sp.]HQK56045.1 YIP1 family protein [Methanolinea sp.]